MGMAAYKMRRAVEKVTLPNRYGTMLPRERLECGHVIHDPDTRVGGERSKLVGIAFRAVSGEKPLRRCYECAKVAPAQPAPTGPPQPTGDICRWCGR